MENEKEHLARAGKIRKHQLVSQLRKAAGRHDYFNVKWNNPASNHPERKYKIVSRKGFYVYVQWEPYVGNTQHYRLSIKYTMREFLTIFSLCDNN